MAAFFAEVFMRLGSIVVAPFDDPLMLWEIGPLLVTLIISELYFGRYRQERLGWNSSVSNSLVLIFVGSNLMHFLFLEDLLDFEQVRSIIPLVLIALGVGLFVLNYFHKWPRFLAFGVSRTLIINILALVGIIIVHEDYALDWFTFLATIVLLIAGAIVFFVVHMLQKSVEEA